MKMKNLILTFLLGILLIFSGCFDITEEITFNKNGSGTTRITVDLTNMMSMFSMFMPDSVKENMDVNQIMGGDMSKYSKMNGISNVRSERLDEYKYAISYDFSSIDVLNKVLESNTESETGLGKMATKYQAKKGKVYRQTEFTATDAHDEHGMDEYMELFSMTDKPKYRVVYHFPSKIKKTKIKGITPVTVKEGNTITMEYNLMDFVESGGKVMDHYIKY